MKSTEKLIIVGVAAVVAIAGAAAILLLSLDGADVEGKLALAQNYLDNAEPDRAKLVYESIIQVEPECAEAYGGLAGVLEEQEDFTQAAETLVSGFEAAGDESLKEKLKGLLTVDIVADSNNPMVSQVTLVAKVGEIRYTTDGSEPTENTGQLYSEPFVLDESGTYEVRAVAFHRGFAGSISEKGIVVENPLDGGNIKIVSCENDQEELRTDTDANFKIKVAYACPDEGEYVIIVGANTGGKDSYSVFEDATQTVTGTGYADFTLDTRPKFYSDASFNFRVELKKPGDEEEEPVGSDTADAGDVRFIVTAVVMDDLMNKTLDEIFWYCDTYGFSCKWAYNIKEGSPEVPVEQWIVCSQLPEAGTSIMPGGTIYLGLVHPQEQWRSPVEASSAQE